MCSFDGPWFGASYPDAMCVDGYLHDADTDVYDPDDDSNPCPRCNPLKYLTQTKDAAMHKAIWPNESQLAHIERLEQALGAIVAAYKLDYPIRTADQHHECGCLRCAVDAADAAISESNE